MDSPEGIGQQMDMMNDVNSARNTLARLSPEDQHMLAAIAPVILYEVLNDIAHGQDPPDSSAILADVLDAHPEAQDAFVHLYLLPK